MQLTDALQQKAHANPLIENKKQTKNKETAIQLRTESTIHIFTLFASFVAF